MVFMLVCRREKSKRGSEFKMFTTIYYKLKYKKQNAIFTHLTENEKFKLLLLASRTKGCFLEIGSYLGASSSFIAEGIIKSGEKNSRLYCVDTWKNHSMSEGERDTFSEFKHNIKMYRDIIVPLQGLSLDQAVNFNQEIDFIFFDGDHSYEGLKLDVETWLPKVKPGGMVVFHDIGWAEGVQRVIREKIEHRVQSVGRLPNLFWGQLKP